MASPIDSWEMRLLGSVFGDEDIIRIENAKFLYANLGKEKSLDQVRENMNTNLTWNFSYAIAGAWGLVFILQRTIPSYGRNVSLGNAIIDGGIFAFSAGLSALYSLREMDAEMRPIQKGWIKEHNMGYIQRMQYMQRHYNIPLLSQIKPFIPAESQFGWKSKYDQLLR